MSLHSYKIPLLLFVAFLLILYIISLSPRITRITGSLKETIHEESVVTLDLSDIFPEVNETTPSYLLAIPEKPLDVMKVIEEDNRTSPEKSSTTTKKPSGPPKFHLIMLFFSVQSEGKYSSFSADQLEGRNKEYMTVLQTNLNHVCVERIHLFYIRDDDLKLILAANLTDSHKLQPVKREQLLHMADFFLYASRNLVNKSVIALNSDIALGEGFQRVDHRALLTRKHFYSLSRYESNISCSVGEQLCAKYRGSHDTHIFALSKPLNEEVLTDRLNYPINMYQAENGMIYTMRTYFGFKVLNPCRVLKTYHHHCSLVHGPLPGSNYTIYSLGWTSEEIHSGLAPPCSL